MFVKITIEHLDAFTKETIFKLWATAHHPAKIRHDEISRFGDNKSKCDITIQALNLHLLADVMGLASCMPFLRYG